MHYIQFNQIVRDAEIANIISSVVREHRLTEGEIKKALLELRIPRAANVARISVSHESGFSRIDAEHAIANGA
jgi:uncharacterized membrane protein YheB (UPF0754 family)